MLFVEARAEDDASAAFNSGLRRTRGVLVLAAATAFLLLGVAFVATAASALAMGMAFAAAAAFAFTVVMAVTAATALAFTVVMAVAAATAFAFTVVVAVAAATAFAFAVVVAFAATAAFAFTVVMAVTAATAFTFTVVVMAVTAAAALAFTVVVMAFAAAAAFAFAVVVAVAAATAFTFTVVVMAVTAATAFFFTVMVMMTVTAAAATAFVMVVAVAAAATAAAFVTNETDRIERGFFFRDFETDHAEHLREVRQGEHGEAVFGVGDAHAAVNERGGGFTHDVDVARHVKDRFDSRTNHPEGTRFVDEHVVHFERAAFFNGHRNVAEFGRDDVGPFGTFGGGEKKRVGAFEKNLGGSSLGRQELRKGRHVNETSE